MSRLQREMDLARAEYQRWFAAWTNPALSESMRQEARERAQVASRQMQKIGRLQRTAQALRAHRVACQHNDMPAALAAYERLCDTLD